jgi:hypothetical protein
MFGDIPFHDAFEYCHVDALRSLAFSGDRVAVEKILREIDERNAVDDSSAGKPRW